MRRLWLPLLIVVFLAACSSTPQKTSRSGGSSASANAWRTRPPGFPNFVDHSIGREEISIQAMSLVGIPYRWGGNTPDSGFDCSGLVKYVFARAARVDLPRTTADMSQRGESIDPDEIAAGDLVFFNTTGRPHSHVGIYVGKLRFVNAPSTGGTVRLDYLTNPYWAKHFDGIRRMAPPKSTPTAPFDTPTWEASAPARGAPVVAAAATAAVPATAPVRPSAAPASTAVAAVPAASAPLAPPMAAATDQSRLTSAPQAAYAGAAPASVPALGTTSAPPGDAFEPPPAALSAAQIQSREAGAVTPATVPSTASAPPAGAPRDAINAAADAFEPPPSGMSAAQRQAAQAGSAPIEPTPSSGAPVQIMHASTAGASAPAPTQSSDDPIARFANGSF